MRLLLLISLIVFICSCKSTYKTIKSDTEKYYPASFISESTSLLYKTKIDAFGNYFSGLLFIKPQSSDSVRIVFMSELGLKFFDFEIIGNENKINYCLEALNKPYIVNTLVNDFRIMLLKVDAKKIKSKQIADSDISSIKYLKPKKTICKFQKPDDRVIELKHKSSFSKSVRITYSDFINKIPEKINIIHRYIKLSIELNLIEKK